MPFHFHLFRPTLVRFRRSRAVRGLMAVGTGLILVLAMGCQSKRSGEVEPGPPPSAERWAFPLQGRWLRGFAVSDRFERRETVSITATNRQGAYLRLERLPGLDAEGARRMIEDGVFNLEALYANALSPYPGDISNRVVTEEAFHPRRAAGPTEPWFILYANERFGFGPSTAGQVKYKALLGWIYCASAEELIKVRLYMSPRTPDATLREWTKNLSCQAAHSNAPPSMSQRHALQH